MSKVALIPLFAFLLFWQCITAQVLTEKRFEMFFGAQGISCDSFPDGSNIDFLNYIEKDDFSGNCAYIGFAGSAKVGEKVLCSVLVGMYSDLSPVNYNVSASYSLFRFIGFGASFLGYPQLIDRYDMYHWNTDVGMYANLNPNYRQRRLYNLGFAAGPQLNYKNKWININMKLHAGVRWTRSLEDAILQKQIAGNYIRLISYETSNSPSLYFFPEVKVGIKLFRISETSIGLRSRFSSEITQRFINYSVISSEWTLDNSSESYIKSPKHNYSKIDFDFGIYFEW